MVAVARNFFLFFLIFPDRPAAFWNSALNRLAHELGASDFKFNIYPPSSESVLRDYLDEAKKSGARLIVSYARPNEYQYKLLADTAKDIPIIFLFDRVDIVNTFFIGTDAQSDGAALRRRSKIGADSRVLILHDDSVLARSRIEGFLSVGEAHADRLVLNENSSAAEIARAVSAYGTVRWDAIYTASHQVRETALAVVKLKLERDVTVLGHDFGDGPFAEGDVNGIRTVALCPDGERVFHAVRSAVCVYTATGHLPERKYTVIPSE